MSDPNAAPAPQGNPNPDPKPNDPVDPAPIDPKPNDPPADPKAGDPPAPIEWKADDKPPPGWGETWREDYAAKVATVDGKLDEKQRDKILNRLKRFPTAKEALDWAFNADKKISDGSYKKPLSDKATAEEVAEYRKANGIPDAPEGYFEKLPGGLVIGEEDKPIFDALGKFLHEKHTPPATVHALVDWYDKFQDEQEGLRVQANTIAKTETDDAMRDEWGPDYRTNINLVNAFVGSMPEDLRDQLFQSTDQQGRQIMNNPKMMAWLAQNARDLNYTGSVLPSGGANAKDLATEIAELEKLSGNKQSVYWKGPKTNGETKESARLLELYDIRSRLEKRKAG